MPTYVPAVYRTSGGDQLQVASGGALVVDSGATASFSARIQAKAGLRNYVAAPTTAATAISNYGVYWVASNTSAGSTQRTVYLSYGTSGDTVTIVQGLTLAGSSAAPIITSSDGAFGSSNTNITMSSGWVTPCYVTLIARTSSDWMIVSMSSGNCALS